MPERRRLNNMAQVALPDLTQLNTKFPVLYIDPPWRMDRAHGPFAANGQGHSGRHQHYQTMTMAELKQLPVPVLAAKDCVLFLWTTSGHFDKALELIKAWGFTYKTTAFVWVKQNKRGAGLFTGMGWYTRLNAEFCLLATKGHPKRINRDVHQIVLSPVSTHSEKPPEVVRRIERLFDGPYLEMFARKSEQNSQWRVWGNQAVRELTLFDAAENHGSELI